MHYIDERVDSGEIITIVSTDVYKTDSVMTLARRHYENEISCMLNFAYHINNPGNPYKDIEASESRMRMPVEKETELVRVFDKYVERYG